MKTFTINKNLELTIGPVGSALTLTIEEAEALYAELGKAIGKPKSDEQIEAIKNLQKQHNEATKNPNPYRDWPRPTPYTPRTPLPQPNPIWCMTNHGTVLPP